MLIEWQAGVNGMLDMHRQTYLEAYDDAHEHVQQISGSLLYLFFIYLYTVSPFEIDTKG